MRTIKLFLLGPTFLLIASMLMQARAEAVSLPFEDDFENIAVGDYPDENGWTPYYVYLLIEAEVSNEESCSGQKSLRIRGTDNGALHADYVYLGQLPSKVTCEVSIYTTSNEGAVGGGAGLYLGKGGEDPSKGLDAGVGIGFELWNSTIYWIAWPDNPEFIYIGTYEPEHWYDVRFDIDFAAGKAKLWLDGELVGDDLPTLFEAPQELFISGQTRSGHAVYLDDIAVYDAAIPEKPTLVGEPRVVDLFSDISLMDWYTIANHALTGLYARAHISATVNNSELVESVEVQVEGVSPSQYQLFAVGDGNYELTLEAKAPVKFIEYLLPHIGLKDIILPPFPYQPIIIKALIINDNTGQSYCYDVDIKIKNLLEHLQEPGAALPWGRVYTFAAYSPVDVLVTKVDDGMHTGTMWSDTGPQELNEISRSLYTGNETEPEFVAIFPESDGSPSYPYILDVYGWTSGVYTLGTTTFEDGVALYQRIHENVSIQNGEHHLYVELPNTQEDIHEAEVDFKPDTFKQTAQRKLVTCYIEPLNIEPSDLIGLYELWVPGGMDPIIAEPTPRKLGDYDNDGIHDIMIKFDGTAIAEYFEHYVVGDHACVIIVGHPDESSNVIGYDYVHIIK